MRNQRNKTKGYTLALVLALTIATTFIASVPLTSGQGKLETWCYVATTPTKVGLGETIYIVGWVSPPSPICGAILESPLNFTITKPDGTTFSHVHESDSPGTHSFSVVCDQEGIWRVMLRFPGDQYHTSAVSPEATFTVEAGYTAPVFPKTPLPDYQWDYPISAEYYEWYQISGIWEQSRYNASHGMFNPYSKGPDSPHILWTLQQGEGGLIGGELGAYSVMGRPVDPVAAHGRLYYTTAEGLGSERHPVLHCVDQYTGEEIYAKALPSDPTNPGTGGTLFIEAQEYIKVDPNVGERIPGAFSLWVYGGGLWEVDPWTGNTLYYWPGGPGSMHYLLYDDGAMYFSNYPNKNELTKWDTRSKSEVWTVDVGNATMWSELQMKYGDFWQFSYILEDVLVCVQQGWAGAPTCLKLLSWNTTNGQLICNGTDVGIYSSQNAQRQHVAYGKYYFQASDMRVHAVDIYTGNLVWSSDTTMEAPWGAFGSYSDSSAYGLEYFGSWDGSLYCYNSETGKEQWRFFTGNTTETASGTYPVWGAVVVADGKVYFSCGQHTTPNPMPRGNKLWCLDAYTGDLIWSFDGFHARGSTNGGISSGILWYGNYYDARLYGFGKGPSATEVSVSQDVIAKGDTTLIKGSVTDQSTAQPGTACVSKESMSAWMGYLHQNKPQPEEVTGVPVFLCALGSDGSYIDIGTVMSNGFYGTFSYAWTPPDEDVYTIVAGFDGDESYWSSSASTALAVVSASEAPGEPTEEPAYTTIDLAIIAAVVVAIIIGIVNLWALRKRS